ncbi:hypothetical protein IJI31_07190 [bacterium]|nr:hypothetical protein [bacterium]
MKKIISLFLLICMINFLSMPVFAKGSTEKVNAEFITELNVNKASKDQIVQFRTIKGYEGIPEGTIFQGKVKSFKKGRWGYRRAKAHIVLEKMILPSGEIYEIKGGTDSHVIKGSAVKNVTKGVITLPVAVVAGAVGACCIVVEAVTIVGIVLIGPTLFIVGETAGKLTHGVNCVKHEGDSVKLKVKGVNIAEPQPAYEQSESQF